MRTTMTTFFAAALLAAATLATSASAQEQVTPAPAPEVKKAPEVNQRQRNQQKRVAGGVQSGELTAHETARIEKREAAIKKEIHTDRKENGGKLTPAQRRKVNRQENRVSKDIYREKHDEQKQPK